LEHRREGHQRGAERKQHQHNVEGARQHLHLRVVFACEQIVVAVETKSPQVERGGNVRRNDGAPADQADHCDRHQPRQHFREFRFQRATGMATIIAKIKSASRLSPLV
jgi:hypothetical protein